PPRGRGGGGRGAAAGGLGAGGARRRAVAGAGGLGLLPADGGGKGSVTATVARIAIAPVKGLGLVPPEAVEVGPRGVDENRRFHVVDEQGLFVNGKRLGPLVQVAPSWDPEAGALRPAFPARRAGD